MQLNNLRPDGQAIDSFTPPQRVRVYGLLEAMGVFVARMGNLSLFLKSVDELSTGN